MADGKEDFSDLAPNQRRKKLKQKVEELQNKVAQETAARDGLLKMKSVYESNSALGNPMTVEGTTLFFAQCYCTKQIVLELKQSWVNVSSHLADPYSYNKENIFHISPSN